jgi:hypothetical protein
MSWLTPTGDANGYAYALLHPQVHIVDKKTISNERCKFGMQNRMKEREYGK